jgi:hypothetical protein
MIKKLLNPVWFFFLQFCLCSIGFYYGDVRKLITLPTTIVSVIFGVVTGIVAGIFWQKSLNANNLNKKLLYSRFASTSQILICLSLLLLPYNKHAGFSALVLC